MAKIIVYNPKVTAKRILEDRRVGLFVASTWEKYFAKYVPFAEGILQSNTTIKPFQVIYESPYAHYQWMGELYVSPTTGSAWAKQDEIKVPTGKALQYSKEQNPLATSHWEEPAYDAFADSVARQVSKYLERL